MKILILLAVLTLASCRSDSTQTPWVKPESTPLGCEDYQSIPVAAGVLYNNVWNKHADTKGTGVQCLESRTVDGALQYGWSWSWPGGRRVIYAYPQIKRGASPWAPVPNSDERFPVKISSLRTLDLAFDVEILTNGIHNLAASMWLTREPIKGEEPNSSVIAAEVMVWTYATKGHFNPAGKKVDTFLVDGVTWEIWFDKNWQDASGVNDNRWTYLTYKSTENLLSTKIDLAKLLAYGVEKQFIAREWYVSNLELGNEIMSGAGITWVKSFDVTVD